MPCLHTHNWPKIPVCWAPMFCGRCLALQAGKFSRWAHLILLPSCHHGIRFQYLPDNHSLRESLSLYLNWNLQDTMHVRRVSWLEGPPQNRNWQQWSKILNVSRLWVLDTPGGPSSSAVALIVQQSTLSPQSSLIHSKRKSAHSARLIRHKCRDGFLQFGVIMKT